ncbi:S8 family serine peptidase [Lentzea sp. BCCO 10_0061]|uniref:S8 family serine peptidase n=1 Tax=Lentzea sokolovensis TaxID=3095429 RepID=A0ABU4VAN3_9PSEU|nr:S8 family serine peptidase [Lentzea sp. BCCO 10_0061]MDX8147920.1 S8 family serine peptidase [Lentzea sp. BCCO 10_0061]
MIESQNEQRATLNLVPDGSSSGLTSLPESVLTQHRARMLDPATAARVPGYVADGPTAYRTEELLVPHDLQVDTLNQVLGFDLGLVLKRDGDEKTRCRLVPDEDVGRRKARVEKGMPAAIDVDAWKALQTLRSATLAGDDRLNNSPGLKEAVEKISLNRLLIGSAMGGIGGMSTLQGVPGAIGGNPDPGAGPGDLGYWRFPVAVQLPPAQRSDDADTPRRPVIAVLDTGIGKNSWLGIVDENDLGSFVSIDPAIQEKVTSPTSHNSIGSYWDHPSTGTPLTGYLSTHTGHGAFVIGIIHQVEPDADVLSIRVMHEDGIVHTDVLITVLERLALRVEAAQAANDEERMIDVVSLSLGGYREDSTQPAKFDMLAEKINELRALGVVVVASAGNYASAREFWPAALATRIVEDEITEGPPVVSVGARNPNGTKTLFTNDAIWVTTWALGAGVVSTFPENTDGSGNPRYRVIAENAAADDRLGIRESLETDNFGSGYAIWAGTSFAAPAVAAQIARLLKESPEAELSQRTTLKRAKAAVRKILGQ